MKKLNQLFCRIFGHNPELPVSFLREVIHRPQTTKIYECTRCGIKQIYRDGEFIDV